MNSRDALATLLSLAMTFVLSAEVALPQSPGGGVASFSLEIGGTVLDPGSGQPWPGAEVRLLGPAETAQGAFTQFILHSALARGRAVTTDRNGSFSFSGLTPGSYHLSATYPDDGDSISQGGTGTSRSLGPGDFSLGAGDPRVEMTLSGADGNREGLSLWLVPRARVSGRITGPAGAPVNGVTVLGFTVTWRLGQQEMASAAGARTDSDGHFELMLPEGTYYISAMPTAQSEGTSPWFYPGVHYPEDAAPLRVSARVPSGIDQPGIDLRLNYTDLFRLQFRVPVPDSLPGVSGPLSEYRGDEHPVEVWVRPLGRGRIVSPAYRIALEVQENDTYLTAPVAPGEYELLIKHPPSLFRSIARTHSGDAAQAAAVLNPFDPIARLRVTVDERAEENPLDLGTIEAGRNAAIQGRVNTRTPKGDAIDLGEIFEGVGFRDVDFLSVAMRAVSPDADGEFVVDGFHPGLFQFRPPDAGHLRPGWYVRSVTSGTRDILKDGLRVGDGFVNPIEIVIADDAGEVAGVVRNADGNLVPGARVVLVPPVNRRGPLSQFPVAVSDANGGFVVDHVSPGQYRILAFDHAGLPDVPYSWGENPGLLGEFERMSLGDPNLLREFETRGEQITLDPDARIIVNLEAVPFK